LITRGFHHEKHSGFKVVYWLGIDLDASKNDYLSLVLVLILDEVQEVVPSLFVKNVSHLSNRLLRSIDAVPLFPHKAFDVVKLHVKAHYVNFWSL